MKILGRRILEVVAPRQADAYDQASFVEAEEARARDTQRLTLTLDGHGRAHLRATLPQAQAAILKKALYALASPRHRAAVENPATHGDDSGPVDRVVPRPTPQRLGAAFCTLIESLPAEGLPTAGGTDATALVITDSPP